MKYLFVILLVISTSFLQGQKNAQQKTKKKNIIKLGLPAVLVSSLALSYEREINEKTAFQIQTNFTATDISTTPNTGFILTAEYRYFPKKEGFVGFYVAPYLRYNRLSFDAEPILNIASNKLNGLALGLLLGKKWHIGNICLDLFGGPQFANSSLKNIDTSIEDEFAFRNTYNGFGIRAGFAVGIIF